MNTTTQKHTQEQYYRYAQRAERNERTPNKDSHEYSRAQIMGHRALATLALAGAGAGVIAGLNYLDKMPTDLDAHNKPIDASISEITLVEGAEVRSSPSEDIYDIDKDNNVIGEVENKSDAANDAITLETPEGVRTEVQVTAYSPKSTYYGVDIDELKKAGVEITGKDNDGIGWINKNDIVNIVDSDYATDTTDTTAIEQ